MDISDKTFKNVVIVLLAVILFYAWLTNQGVWALQKKVNCIFSYSDKSARDACWALYQLRDGK